jgi:hypothetical protein
MNAGFGIGGLLVAWLVAALGASRLQRSLPAAVDLISDRRVDLTEPAIVPAATTHG